MVSRTQLVGLFNELFGITEIRTNDLRYNVEGKDGKLTTQRFWGKSKVSFLASYNGLQNFGVGLWGVTPEEEQLGPWTAKSAEQFVTLTQWTEPDPRPSGLRRLVCSCPFCRTPRACSSPLPSCSKEGGAVSGRCQLRVV